MNNGLTFWNGNKGNNTDNFNLEGIMQVLGQTSEIVKSNTESTAVIMEDLKQQKNIIGYISKTVKNLDDKMVCIDDRMTNIEQNEEITTEQHENITMATKRRIMSILGDNPLDKQKYYRIFAQTLYSDARHNSSMGNKVSRTHKRDYQRVIDYIEAWTPKCGCLGLKLRADNNAKARLEAIKSGY